MKIIKYTNTYLEQYKETIKLLWNDIDEKEIISLTNEHINEKATIYLAVEDEKVVGFLNTSVRVDYVEGSDSEKTGYIEGIFVKEAYRKQNIGKELLQSAFDYFKSKNITEVGSDAHVDNMLSDSFHKKVGFKEVEVNRHYIFKL